MAKTQLTKGPSTANWRALGVRVPAELAKALRILAAKKDKTMQEILVESIRDVLKKYGEHMPTVK